MTAPPDALGGLVGDLRRAWRRLTPAQRRRTVAVLWDPAALEVFRERLPRAASRELPSVEAPEGAWAVCDLRGRAWVTRLVGCWPHPQEVDLSALAAPGEPLTLVAFLLGAEPPSVVVVDLGG